MVQSIDPGQAFPARCDYHSGCRERLLSAAESLCRESGTSLTANRRAVLDILSESHHSLGAYDILERMDAGAGRRPGPAAVYRALEFLSGLGLVHRLGSRNSWFACSRPGEHRGRSQYWICANCGVVGETESEEIAQILPELALSMAFRLDRVSIEIEGECRGCQLQIKG
ncbi:MAG: transcriptional repressor [Nitrospirae bacterium]|nr:transcriptional repressor [Magnetococcales bacterium]